MLLVVVMKFKGIDQICKSEEILSEIREEYSFLFTHIDEHLKTSNN